MSNPIWSRRQFIAGCSTAAAAVVGSRLVSLSFADEHAGNSSGRDILVVLFLRGGMDGLNLVAPVDDPNYIASRAPALRLAPAGEGAALPLANGPIKADFRIHPKAAALKELYDGKQLAIVHACGLTNGTRSHFEAMDLMERGVADLQQQNLSTGWLARHLTQIKPAGLLPGVSAAPSLPSSLLGYTNGAAIASPQDFAFYGDARQLAVLEKAYASQGPLGRSGANTLKAIGIIRERLKHNEQGEIQPYAPEANAAYPDGDLSQALKTVACLIKADVGMEVAAVDYGGWDTHQNQADTFSALVEQLSGALAGFYRDVSKYHQRLSVVVMSEFGRRLKSNESTGTDHGHGNVMLALGGNVNGGKIFGPWPGLATEQLDNRADLAVATDYRTVLSELLARRLQNGQLAATFPGLASYRPLGVFRGTDVKTDVAG